MTTRRAAAPIFYDAATGHRLIDFYGFFGSIPVGFNHPHFDETGSRRGPAPRGENQDRQLRRLLGRPTRDFVETFTRVAPLPPLERYLFIEGGALAIENA